MENFGFIALDRDGKPLVDNYGSVIFWEDVEQATEESKAVPGVSLKRVVKVRKKRKKPEKK